MTKFDLFINGEVVSATDGKYFDSINPSTGEVFANVSSGTSADMRCAITAARTAFDAGPWPRLSVRERGQYLIKIAELIRANAKELAQLECRDVGKTIKHTTFIDVPTVAETFEYFGKIDEKVFTRQNAIAAPVHSLVTHEPVGVVGGIIPWNYPLIMFGWKVAPALIAGNTVVFKPSSQASVSILRLAQIIQASALPTGVLNVISAKDHTVVTEMITSPDVDLISFTGGTETGRQVMNAASATVKKVGLELGGKSPNIVFADCDPTAALGGTLSAIFMNQGQMCTAGSRLLLEESIYDEFLAKLAARAKTLKIGNADESQTEFGPLISQRHRDNVLQYIQKGIDEGARLVCGGKIPDDTMLQNGYYLEPTILADVDNSMTVAQEEIFGPVLCVIKFSGVEEAIKIANDSIYGLASCVWTKDAKKADQVARQLKCGTVWINTYGGFYNEAPFGGYKQSGIGRELGSEGLLEYTQSKHICRDQTPGGKPLVSSWF